MFFRTMFNHDTNVASDEAGLSCPEEDGLTQQQFAVECDINTIVTRFGLTGELPSNVAMPVSGDFTGISDFHSAMNIVAQANEAFMALPASVRQRFGHDPQQLMAFVEDDNNRDEALRLGLIERPVERTRDVVQAVDELASILKPKV